MRIAGLALSVACMAAPADAFQAAPTMPDALRGLLQSLPPEVAQPLLQSTVDTLAVAIRQANAQASRTARPMPPQLQRVLAPYFPAGVLANVRFTTDARAGGGMASLLIENNAALNAVTVGDIILFRGEAQAADPCIWAHELVHVLQYDRMGVDAFAAAYATRFDEIERPAYDYQRDVCEALRERAAR
jgi:hypothetical protein